jgi:elongation factor G
MFDSNKVRNIGIAAHIDSGKTTITERILFFTGEIHKIGEVHDGTSKTDWLEEEMKRGITITSSAVTCNYKDTQINIIDTPGHVDFTMEVERSFSVLDGGILAVESVAGVEAQTMTVSMQAARYKVPLICFVNKLDRQGANYFACIEGIKDKLGLNPICMVIPVYEASEDLSKDDKFCGIIELIEQKYYRWGPEDKIQNFTIEDIPEKYIEISKEKRQELIETTVLESDEPDIIEICFSNQEISNDEIRRLVRKGVKNRKILPVFGGAALRNKGIQNLMDAIVYYLPSPQDREDIEVSPVNRNGVILKDEEGNDKIVKMSCDPKGNVCVFAFKTQFLERFGHITFVRCYSGTVSRGDILYNTTNGKEERISKIARIDANKLEEISELTAGDIAGFCLKSGETRTGDVLVNPNFMIKMKGMKIPEAVVEMAIEAQDKNQEEEVVRVLQKVSFDDPSLKIGRNRHNQLTISGMGELHLEVTVNRMRQEHKLIVTAGKPQVSYTATFVEKIDYTHRHIKQTGGNGQFAIMSMRIEPGAVGSGMQFVSQIIGGVIKTEYIPSIKMGVEAAAKEGVEGRFPITDFKIVLYDGAYHDVDSSSHTFELAAKSAFREMMKMGKIRILEPIMEVEIMIPSSNMGDIMGDTEKRRGKITSVEETDSHSSKINALIPLSEMFGYTNDLRSKTHGHGASTSTLHSYDFVPELIAGKLLKTEEVVEEKENKPTNRKK